MCFFKTFRIRRLTKKLPPLQQHRTMHQVDDAAIKNECLIYHKLHALYTKLVGNVRYPFAAVMAIECLRMASQLHDADSQYQLGKHFLDEAKWREGLETEKIFASEANQNTMKALYRDAHAYLSAAEKQGHILAIRYYGLCYIFGWGVPIDKDKGFAMVVDSIAKENSWSKAPQIFATLGLNTPEFFEAFVKQQAKRG